MSSGVWPGGCAPDRVLLGIHWAGPQDEDPSPVENPHVGVLMRGAESCL
jgi:hypothetical protein